MLKPDFSKLSTTQRSEKYIAKHYLEFYNWIKSNYQTDSFAESIYLYTHNMQSAPVCSNCGKLLHFRTNTHTYGKYCSSKCCNSDKDKLLKQQQTILENYSVQNISQLDDIKYKKQKTTEEHYGVTNPSQAQDVKDKKCATKLQRYGDANYNNHRKSQQTWLNNYGVDHPSKSPDIMDKKHKTNLQNWGVDWSCQLPQAKQYCKDSKPNMLFEQLLQSANISYEREFPLEGYSYDFKVNNTLIEINPTGTHNINFGIFGNLPKQIDYHLNKTNTAKSHGYQIINVWDWDDTNKIILNLCSKTVIYARKCKILEVSKQECDDFLNKYHYQGTCNKQDIRYGLYYNNELVQLMTFGTPRYNKRYQYELLRLCTTALYTVVGGSQRLFAHFIKLNSPQSIISYCDMSKFSGSVYNTLGFQLIHKGKPSIHWYKNGLHITDNLLRQRGYDQLFKTNYGKNTSNDQLMLDHNFLQVADCGQNTYVWKQKRD